MAKDAEFCPPLPTGSVDFNKLHEAAKKGEDLSDTLDRITTTTVRANAVTKPQPADAGSPAVPPPADTDKPAA